MSYITDTSTPASKVIHLDSAHAHLYHQKDEDGNSITTNFIYHMKEAINCPEHLSMICSLHTATIPYSFYNVRHKVNNFLIVDYTDHANTYSGIYKIVIPSGNYTAYSLMDKILEIMGGSSAYLASPWAPGQFPLYKLVNDKFQLTLANPFLSSQTPYILKMEFDLTRLRYKFSSTSSALNGLIFQFATSTADGSTTCADL
eukprot:SAG11_NODE_7575_length_1126_cov_54.943525_3_plen_200_part_01